MSRNELKYTSLTHEDILRQIYDRFLKTPDGETNHKFDNFRESAIAQTLMEIFAGVVDINNYYIQRRAEECYFDTAQLKSSVISLSRMFGYVMNRREPSKAKIRMIIDGDIGDNQIQIPYYSKFSFNGNPFILKNTLTYRMSDTDYRTMLSDTKLFIDKDSFGRDIEIIQGVIKEKVINGETNPQVNAPFQIYKIEDKTFSNLYGENDFLYNDVTRVYVGENKIDSDDDTNTRFKIDRRSLLNWENIYNSSDLGTSEKVCVIRTATDGFVEILFGDGDDRNITGQDVDYTKGFARKGAISKKDNIYIQYLSCLGKESNEYGVIGNKVDFSGKIFNSRGEDITDKISFELISNVYGGADEESKESIKYSSPKIYYSLDRLVSKDDYIAYLKTLNSPITVQNAIAWGEQEERDLGHNFALIKMFNVVLFTLTGSLYDIDTIPHKPKQGLEYNDVTLDINYNPYKFQTQGYFNVFIIQQMVNQLNRYSTKSTFYEIDGNNLLNSETITIEQKADEIRNQIKVNYPSGDISIGFTYRSDYHEYVSDIVAHGVAKISSSDLNNIDQNITGHDYFEKLNKYINDALLDFKDYRGNKNDNANFKKQAFFGRWYNSQSQDNYIIKWDKVDNSTNSTLQYNNGYVNQYRIRFNESNINNGENPSPCYIEKFDDDLVSLLGIIGLSGKQSYPVNETIQKNTMNGKISDVVDKLTRRSQVNVKNIYVSPIIHRFLLAGDIYIKSLYDAQTVRNEITDMLYEWLDINADFNKPIYISDIINIIHSHTGVINANVSLIPEDVTRGTDNSTNYNIAYDPNPLTNSIYRKYNKYYDGTPGYINATFLNNPIAEIINNKLSQYLSPYIDNTNNDNKSDSFSDNLIEQYWKSMSSDNDTDNNGANIEWYREFIIKRDYKVAYESGTGIQDDILAVGPNVGGKETKTLESLKYTLLNHITERSFYNDFVNDLYNTFYNLSITNGCNSSDEYRCPITDDNPNGGPNYGLFIGVSDVNSNYRDEVVHSTIVDSDFSVIMEQIYSDLSYVIMENMIDSHGNIDVEYDNNNEYVRGGYTIGSEIVQVLLDEDKEYKDVNGNIIKTKYLNVRYK